MKMQYRFYLMLFVLLLTGCNDSDSSISSLVKKEDIRESNWGATLDDVLEVEKERFQNMEPFIMREADRHKNAEFKNVDVILDDVKFTDIEEERVSLAYHFFAHRFYSVMQDGEGGALKIMKEQDANLEEPILLKASYSFDVEPTPLITYQERKKEFGDKLVKELKKKYGEPNVIENLYIWETDRTIIRYYLFNLELEAKYKAVADIAEFMQVPPAD
ncbi:hypothetical protein HNQ94_001789 [Salirhabdus euzebyi]|uniref:Lipoprotein n=1 Tax=Salirhabdus euzebyi TaxID=394506 RepID=A0A841Q4K0_9BACI|nr:hypothetical protein [Salirhabdus euzebyi]MBB6453341.1 hypothetical protein [Salirhabdus euzebyi]